MDNSKITKLAEWLCAPSESKDREFRAQVYCLWENYVTKQHVLSLVMMFRTMKFHGIAIDDLMKEGVMLRDIQAAIDEQK